MDEQFKIPILTQESWDELQFHLDSISSLIKLTDKDGDTDRLDNVSIHLGLIDTILGRVHEFRLTND